MEQYSESEHADEAWDRWMEFLSIAASHVETRRTELVRAEEKWLSDPKVTKTQREIIRGNQIERTADPIQCEQMVRQFMHETHSPDTFFCWHMLQIAGSADSMQARRLVDEVLKKTAEVRGLSSVRDRALLLSRNLERVGKRFDLSFQSLQGNAIELSAYRGKVVLVHFWATWCPPCIAKLPELKTLRQTHGAKGFEIVSITYDTDREKLARFVENHDIEWPQFFDPRGMECDLVQRLGAPGPPAYWLIDQDGMLIEIGAGPKLDRLITEQLNRDSRR
jgi:thiol-disulfide isomerase/thioredoxin